MVDEFTSPKGGPTQINEPEVKDEAFDQESYDATQGLINRLSDQLDELSKEMREQREMLKNIFDNDQELAQAEEVAKDATQTIKSRKTELNESKEARDLKVKIGDLNEEIKMIKESLNTHLINYFQMTGSMVIDTPDGKEREFKLEAKLKPKKNE